MKKTYITLISLIVILIIAILFYLSLGSYSMSFPDVIKTLFGYGSKMENFAIFNLRLPRLILALVVSLGLTTSGVIFQTITKNPLAEPGIIGINSGAALFVIFLISLSGEYYSKIPISSALLMPIVGTLGALLSMGIIYLLSYKKGFKPIRFILTGVGINALFSSIITLFQMSVSKGDYNRVLNWISGSLWGSNYEYILISFIPILIFVLIAFLRGKTLDALILGDELSYGIGVNVRFEFLFFIIIASILGAVATSVAGNIAFLGFVAPQIGKKIVTNHRAIMIFSFLIGSIILLISDAIGKNLFSPIEIPVGIIVSIIGVPYFIILMIKDRRL